MKDNNIKVIEINWEDDNLFFRHVKNIAKNLRKGDYDEIKAIDAEPFDAVMDSCKRSVRKWIVIKREGSLCIPIAIFGITDYGPGNNIGVPWMVATDGIKKIGRFVMKHAMKYINIMLIKYKSLFNLVDCRNEYAIKWLKKCGFNFVDEPILLGKDNMPFRYFYMR